MKFRLATALILVSALIAISVPDARAGVITLDIDSSTGVQGPHFMNCPVPVWSLSNGSQILMLEIANGCFVSYGFSDLNGIALAGQTISLDIWFDHRSMWDHLPGTDFTLALMTDFPGDPGAATSVTAHGYRQDGSSITTGGNGFFAWSRPTGETLLSFRGTHTNTFGIRVDFTLPNDPGYFITGGTAEVTSSVAEPEPNSAILLVLGMVALVVKRSR